MDIDVRHEDEDLIVLSKPAGVVVHPSPGHDTGTLVNGLLHHCPGLQGIGGVVRPGIVHRLDKDTSGVLVVAKNAWALDHLARQFKSRQVVKTYLAIVHGEIAREEGRIALPIGRDPLDRKRMSTVDTSRKGKSGRGKGRDAETLWRVIDRLGGTTLLELRPKTGRTHQLRVHCRAMEHPILGDPVYGRSRMPKHLASAERRRIRLVRSVRRQMLHAWKIRFTHPVSSEPMSFESPMPRDMTDLMRALRQADRQQE